MRLTDAGDSISGEKIGCQFRKMSRPMVTAGTGRHKSQRLFIHGIPAICWIDKPLMLSRKK